ncbi:hypothetical protein EAG18_02215 [Pseudoalteromonas sp. J010]|uniref:hypothetical protein n=1 Tax=Pseudoalteromonas sp. J010 TaxID=998465 RepID=UPI000F64A11C|nr:hypothetical protein [Pseudoalteromonas sp. J010]RRS10394.1 hypothetical protein EAG18_02215 [Pseudoalteromonas sp. J010]
MINCDGCHLFFRSYFSAYFSPLKDHHASHWFSYDNFEEHHEMIVRLRAEGVITDSGIIEALEENGYHRYVAELNAHEK